VRQPEASFEDLLAGLKRAAAALGDAEVPYVVAGGLAGWAHGGPETVHDLDLMLRPQDAERALAALARAGLRLERPPEDWLVKAWDGDVLVDLIFAPQGVTVDDELLARAEVLNVGGMNMPVMHLDDLMVSKLLALDEHYLEYGALLGLARALRERIDWEAIRARTEHSPFARAFFTMVEGLGVAPAEAAG
jgi:hypothetical protein